MRRVVCLVLLVLTVSASLPQAPLEWRDRIQSNQRLWSKSLVSTARHHQPGMPLLIPSIGNGYLATVAGSHTVHVGGLFNGKNENGVELTAPSHRARVPAFLNVNVTSSHVDYMPLNASSPLLGGFAIDVREGKIGNSDSGAVMQIEQARYCHRKYESIIVHEMHFDNSISAVSEEFVVDLEVDSTTDEEDLVLTEVADCPDDTIMYRGSITQPELNSSLPVQVGIVVSTIPRNLTIQPGEKKTVTFLFAIRTNIPGDKIQAGEEPYQAALGDYQAARSLQDRGDHGPRTPLWESHVAEWEQEVWSQGDIVIHGNDELAQIVYSSLYWIMMSTRADWPWSLSPGSLASNAYNGHSFWDTETWMYPPLLLLYPDIAESLLTYRFNHLEASQAKARSYNHCGPTDKKLYDCVIWPPDKALWSSWNNAQKQRMAEIVNYLFASVIDPQHMPTVPFQNLFNQLDENAPVTADYQGNCGYKGAMFAWESAFTGAETCPCMAGGTCLYEHHISGDVAFAAYQYWQLTHDLEWLETQGFPLAYEIAVFYESRGEWEAGEYVIKGVIPPDEAALGQDNSVYTNVIAMYSFQIAREFASILSKETPSIWDDMAERMKIPFDMERRIHLEYDGYESSAIKQADVILLGYPLQYAMSEEIRENDLNFYSDVTSRYGPAMTWSVTSIGYLELFTSRLAQAACQGSPKEAQKELEDLVQKVSFYFFQSYQNAQPPYYIWTETPRGGAYNFITGAGGFIQALMAGFGGIRLRSDGYHIQMPVLPPDATSWEMRHLNYLGNAFDLSLNTTTLSLRLTHHNPASPLTAEVIDQCSHNATVLRSQVLVEGEVFTSPSRIHLRLFATNQTHPSEEPNWFGKPVRTKISWREYLDSTTFALSLVALVVIVLLDRTFYQ